MSANRTFAFVTIGSGSCRVHRARPHPRHSLRGRGFKVAVHGMTECKPELVADGIRQRMLCHGLHYHFRQPSEILDKNVGPLLFLFHARERVRVAQGVPGYVDGLLENPTRCLHRTPDPDPMLVKRPIKFIALDGVSHLMMSFAAILPVALAAKENSARPFDWLVTFPGYARKFGLLTEKPAD